MKTLTLKETVNPLPFYLYFLLTDPYMEKMCKNYFVKFFNEPDEDDYYFIIRSLKGQTVGYMKRRPQAYTVRIRAGGKTIFY